MATEKRLIDANKIYDAVEQRYRVSSGVEHRCERDLLDLICSADTVDAVEVVHGHNTYDHDSAFECSVCGFSDWDTMTADFGKYNYCPGCGAKMDGGADHA